MLNVPSIGPSTPFLGKLVESLQMRLFVQLIKTKMFSIVLYCGLEACPLRKSAHYLQFSSLNYVGLKQHF